MLKFQSILQGRAFESLIYHQVPQAYNINIMKQAGSISKSNQNTQTSTQLDSKEVKLCQKNHNISQGKQNEGFKYQFLKIHKEAFSETIKSNKNQAQLAPTAIQALYEHISCLRYQMPRVFNIIFKLNTSSIFQNLSEQSEPPQIQTVEEYIANQLTKYQLFSMPNASYIFMNERIKTFVQWIYDAAPMLFYKQLIIAACRILYFFCSYKNSILTSLTKQDLKQISQNVIFLHQIYSHPTFNYFKVDATPLCSNGFMINVQPQVLGFIIFFTHTVLLVAQGWEHNPLYATIPQEYESKQQQEDNGLAIRKRKTKTIIKKRKQKLHQFEKL